MPKFFTIYSESSKRQHVLNSVLLKLYVILLKAGSLSTFLSIAVNKNPKMMNNESNFDGFSAIEDNDGEITQRTFRCNLCLFANTDMAGMKRHITRIHKVSAVPIFILIYFRTNTIYKLQTYMSINKYET